MTTLTSRAAKGSELTHNELDNNFKRGTQTKSADYTVLISDNRETIEFSTASIATLSDASTLATASNTGDFEVTIKNLSTGAVTISRLSSGDTIDGVTSDVVISAKSSYTFKVNQAGNGFNTVGFAHGATITVDIVGNVTGDVTGDVTGNVTGDVAGNADTATNADTVTTNANLTGNVTSVGNVTTITDETIDNAKLVSPATGAVIIKRVLTSSETTTTATAYPALLTYGNIGTVLVAGTIKVQWEMADDGGNVSVRSRILLNGVQQTEPINGTSSFITYSVDIPVAVGDAIDYQIRIEAATNTCRIKNMVVLSDTANMAIA